MKSKKIPYAGEYRKYIVAETQMKSRFILCEIAGALLSRGSPRCHCGPGY
jgi:hypothetical protein